MDHAVEHLVLVPGLPDVAALVVVCELEDIVQNLVTLGLLAQRLVQIVLDLSEHHLALWLDVLLEQLWLHLCLLEERVLLGLWLRLFIWRRNGLFVDIVRYVFVSHDFGLEFV